jgi:cell division septation protein DedD
MSTETRSSTNVPKPRRKLVIAAVLAAFAILATSAVAYWSSDSWSDEAMSSGAFPGLPGGIWDTTESADGWGDTSSSSSTTSTSTTGTTSAQPSTTGVIEPASQPTQVATSKAPLPTSTATSTAPTPTSTSAPRPPETRENPKPKPTSTKKPTPTSSPTSSEDGGCTLLIIC